MKASKKMILFLKRLRREKKKKLTVMDNFNTAVMSRKKIICSRELLILILVSNI